MLKFARKLKETISHLAGLFVKPSLIQEVNKKEKFIEKNYSHIKLESLHYQSYYGKEPLSKYKVTINQSTGHIDGPKESEITRFGYWEYKGRCEDSKNRNWKDIYHENVTALREINPTLPGTVFLLEKPCGSKVYVVGVIHNTTKSINDVIDVMNKTLPDCVILELCKYRSFSLIKYPQDMKWIMYKLRDRIENIGILNFLILFLLGKITEKINGIDKKHDGEFKAAFHKANELPCCPVILGDRDIDITIKRAVTPLSFKNQITIIFALLFGISFAKKPEFDSKNPGNSEKFNEQMRKHLPSIYRAIVEERDLYLTKSIWDSVLPVDKEGEIPSINVAVVGMGHSPGIKKNWKCAANIDLLELST